MGIPKLKVYRLDEGYSESNDNDIQSQSGDELLPVVEKNLNLGNVEEMVGVVQRGDARTVIEDNVLNEAALEVDSSEELKKTVMFPCDGWVLGKDNLQLWLKKKPHDDEASDGEGQAGNRYNVSTKWFEVENYMWDYEIQQMVFYQGTISGNGYDRPLNNVIIGGRFYRSYIAPSDMAQTYVESANPVLDSYTGVIMRDMIVFRLGNLITNTSLFFDDGYKSSNWKPIFSDSETVSSSSSGEGTDWENDPNVFVNKAVVKYHKYHECGTISSSAVPGPSSEYISAYRVAFGDIYNGNRTGRCLHYEGGSNTSIPDGVNGTHLPMDHYEGNCNYKRRIFPLKYKKRKTVNGTCNFTYNDNWYLDGLMKPVAMIRIPTADDGRLIFKPLVEGTQVTKAGPVNDGENKYYPVSLISSFYKIGNNDFYYPDEIYLFYNEISDVCGSIFDFDYDYSGTVQPNSGRIKFPLSIASNTAIFNGNEMKYCLVKKQVLAIQDLYGYQSSSSGDSSVEPDLLLNVSNATASFTLSDADFYENSNYQAKIYVDGREIWRTNSGQSSSSSSGAEDAVIVTHSVGNGSWSVEFSSDDKVPKDLLLIYYARIPMAPAFDISSSSSSLSDSDEEIVVCGYRVPCYQKSKKTRLFVSSFPNWLKGHLNNDLDVFIGNKQYSGVEVQGTAVDTIMPNYVKEGWNAIYPEGAVMFTEEKEEYDWYDIFNYTKAKSDSGSNSGITIDTSDYSQFNTASIVPNYCGATLSTQQYRLLYQKVCYNVAHYDGIYTPVRALLSNYSVQNGAWYALLDDDDFSDAFGKRWVIRDDGQIRRFFESDQTVLPNVVTVTQEETDLLCTVSSTDEQDGTVINTQNDDVIVRLWPDGDRVLAVKYVPGPHTGKIYLNPRASDSNYGKMGTDTSILGDVALRISINNGVFMITTSNNVDYPLPPIPSTLDCDLSHVQMDTATIGPGESSSSSGGDGLPPVLYRYKCTDDLWNRDAYIEVFSYNYSNSSVSYVEFLIYTIKK